MYSTFARKSGAIRYPAAIIPKVVAPANHKADVRVNALAVEFGAALSMVSSDKVKTPFTLRVVIRYWYHGDLPFFQITNNA
jgi:hypothetical protein